MSSEIKRPSILLAASLAANGLLTPLCHAQTPPQPVEVAAPAPAPAPAAGPHVEVSAGVSHQRVSNDFGDWDSQSVQVRAGFSPDDQLVATVEHAKRFRESGSLLGVQWQHDFSDRWRTNLAVAGTTGGTFWPASQASVGLYSLLLPQRNLIVGARLAHNISRRGYRDDLLEASAIWYASSGWVFQAGVQHNQSKPGSVNTTRVFGAVTYGAGSNTEVTVLGSTGREGYQQGIGDVRVDFHSSEVSVLLRQRLSSSWAVDARLVRYSNPFYKREGVGVALVYQF